MSFIKQSISILFAMVIGITGWVFVSPSAIDTLGQYNLDFGLWQAVARLGHEDKAAAKNTKSSKGKNRRSARKSLVTVTSVTREVVNNKLTAIGSGRAIRSVTVTPLDSGQITKLPIETGSAVKKGVILAELDVAVEELARDRAALTGQNFTTKVERAEQLLIRRTVSIVQVENAQTELRTAEVALREAKLAVTRRTIRSPIDGIVGIVSASIGDYATTASPIVIVEDRSKIIVEYFVPERFVTAIVKGADIVASSIARPGEVFAGTVVAIDNRIDVASRTLRVRAELDNADDKLRGGMAFKVNMDFEGDTYPAVDPLAIQWDSKGSYVWQVGEDGKAIRQKARIIQRNPENVLIEAALKEGDLVVAEGVQNVRAGAKLTIAKQENEPSVIIQKEKAAGS